MNKNQIIKFIISITATIITSAIITIILVLSAHNLPYFDKYILKKVEKQMFVEPQHGIVVPQEGSFKRFILNNNTPNLLKNLYKNLDKESIEKLNIAINAMLHVPDENYLKFFYFKSDRFNRNFHSRLNTFHSDKTFEEELPTIMEKYKLPSGIEYNYGIFYNEHNIRFSTEKLKNYIKNKVFIDGNAFVGDSALVLLKYEPSKIYSFENSDINLKLFDETIKLNNIDKNKVNIIKGKIAEKDNLNKNNNTVTIDSFIKNKKETVGFIKLGDDEYIHETIKGMKNTIKKYRPVLLLDISTSAHAFFYTKPILENIIGDLDYTIKITNFDIASNITGTSLWAYPKELDN